MITGRSREITGRSRREDHGEVKRRACRSACHSCMSSSFEKRKKKFFPALPHCGAARADALSPCPGPPTTPAHGARAAHWDAQMDKEEVGELGGESLVGEGGVHRAARAVEEPRTWEIQARYSGDVGEI